MQANPIQVVLGDSVNTLPVVRFERTATFSAHTVAVLDLGFSSARVGAAAPDVVPELTPVVITLTDGVISEDWYGYVHHGGLVTDIREATGALVRYTLIGTSLPMNQPDSRAWKATSYSAIARQIGKAHRLRTVITPTRTPVDYHAQGGDSDFKVLQGLAEKTGYRLWVDGATMLFIDARTMLRSVRAFEVPTFTQNRLPGSRDTLIEFKSKVGTMVPRKGGQTARQVVHGLDPRTGRLITAVSDANLGAGPTGPKPTFSNINTGARVGSAAQAQQMVNSASVKSQGWLTAKAVVIGTPGLTPGTVVDIEGSTIADDQRGLWLVTKVEQRVLFDKSNPLYPYMTTLELERDQYYSPTFTRSFQTINTRDVVPAIIRNGVFWEAERMEDVSVD